MKFTLPNPDTDVELLLVNLICKQLKDISTYGEHFVSAMYKACAYVASSKGL